MAKYAAPNKPRAYYERLARSYAGVGMERDPDEMRIADMARQPVAEVRGPDRATARPTINAVAPTRQPVAAQPVRLPFGMDTSGLDPRRTYRLPAQRPQQPQVAPEVEDFDNYLKGLDPAQQSQAIQAARQRPEMQTVLQGSRLARQISYGQALGVQPAAKPTEADKMTARKEYHQWESQFDEQTRQARMRNDRQAMEDVARSKALQFDPARFDLPANIAGNIKQIRQGIGRTIDPETAWRAIQDLAKPFLKDEETQRQRVERQNKESQGRMDQTAQRQARTERWTRATKRYDVLTRRIDKAESEADKLQKRIAQAKDAGETTAYEETRLKEVQRQIEADRKMLEPLERELMNDPEDEPGPAAPAQPVTGQPAEAPPEETAQPIDPKYVEGVVQGAIKDLGNGKPVADVLAGITNEEVAAMTPNQAAALLTARRRAEGRK